VLINFVDAINDATNCAKPSPGAQVYFLTKPQKTFIPCNKYLMPITYNSETRTKTQLQKTGKYFWHQNLARKSGIDFQGGLENCSITSRNLA